MRKAGSTFHQVLLLWNVTVSLVVLYVVHNIQSNTKNEKLKCILKNYLWVFLTFWGYAAQLISLALDVVCHKLEANGSVESYKRIKPTADFFFSAVAAPVACGVTVLFWVVRSIDYRLIADKEFILGLPLWLNHSSHTFNALAALVDLVLFHRTIPSWSSAAKAMIWFYLLYFSNVYLMYFITSIWIYPLFEEMTPLGRPLFMCFVMFCNVILMTVMRQIQILAVTCQGTQRKSNSAKK